MNSRWVKMGATLIAACLFIVTGCSANNNVNTKENNNVAATSNVEKEVPTIEIMTPWDPGLPISSDLPVFVEWGKRTGVKFNVNSPPRDAYKEKMNIVLASKELPDMIKFFQDTNTFKDYGPQLFVALDDYIADGKLPNLEKWLKKYPEIEKAMRNPEDGKLYAFPLVQDFDYPTTLWQVRNDILNKEGLDASDIKTLDDFKEAMLALKKQTGDYITSARLGLGYFMARTQAYYGLTSGNGMVYDPDAEKYVFSPIELKDRYKQWLELIKWMYDEKLLHPNFLTMKDQELFAGYESDDFPLMMEQTGMNNLNPTHDPNKDVEPIYPFPIDGKIYAQTVDPHYNIGYRSPMVINKNSKHIDDIIRAMDYTYSDEGIEFFELGVEGETYTKDPSTPSGYKLDKTQSVWTVDENGKFPDGLKKMSDYGYGRWWLTGVITPMERFGLLGYKEGEDEKANVIPDRIQKLNDLGALRSPDPYLNWTKDESSKLAEITTPLNTYLNENISKFILGQKPMSEWDSYVDGFKKLKYEELTKMYNDKLMESK